MYSTISDFIKEWNKEAILTQNVLDSLTDDSLEQQVYPEGRTLGKNCVAFHYEYSRLSRSFRVKDRPDRKFGKRPIFSPGNCYHF